MESASVVAKEGKMDDVWRAELLKVEGRGVGGRRRAERGGWEGGEEGGGEMRQWSAEVNKCLAALGKFSLFDSGYDELRQHNANQPQK